MDTIRQAQFESSVLAIQDEFNDGDHPLPVIDSSTPKKITTPILVNSADPLENLEQKVNEQFDEDDDETIRAGSSTPSDQSLASFRSAVSTTEDNPLSPDVETSLTN